MKVVSTGWQLALTQSRDFSGYGCPRSRDDERHSWQRDLHMYLGQMQLQKAPWSVKKLWV
jgi:hypothetical protein